MLILNNVHDLKGVNYTVGNHIFISRTDVRQHANYQLVGSYSLKFCMEGKETYIVNEQNHELRQGQCLIINPGSTVDWNSPAHSNSLGFSVFIDTEWLHEHLIYPSSIDEIPDHTVPDPPVAHQFYDHPFSSDSHLGYLIKSFVKGRFNRARHSFLNRICFEMVNIEKPLKKLIKRDNPKKLSTKRELIRRLTKAYDIIHQSLYDQLDLTTLSNSCGISQYHLIRTFKEVYELTPMKLLQDLRLHESLKLLHKKWPIYQIAYDLNFHDVSHFSRAFKHKYGKTPSSM